jgi:hypothetical protein
MINGFGNSVHTVNQNLAPVPTTMIGVQPTVPDLMPARDPGSVACEGLEVADVFSHFGPAFREQHGASPSAAWRHAMTAIERCRTVAFGGYVERCSDCGHQPVAYNSCLMGKTSNRELATT